MAVLTCCWMTDMAIFLVASFASLYFFFQHKFNHFQKRGIPIIETPSFPYGNAQGAGTRNATPVILSNLYAKSKDVKLFGVYLFMKPIVIPKDLELVKKMIVKDFSAFHDRGFEVNTEKDPLGGHIFLMNGQEWRNLRVKLTPTFTSGKMKFMFPTLIDIGKQLTEVLEVSSKEPEVEIKDILARFFTDVISSVAFGLECNSLKNPDAEFRRIGKEVTAPSTYRTILNLMIFAAPKVIVKNLPIRFIPKEHNDFFIGTVRDVMDYRIKNSVKRNDFLQLLIQLRTLGYIPDADSKYENTDVPEKAPEFTIEQAAAQAFIFFFAGFETSSTTMQFALYELALNQELQAEVQAEIDQVIAKNGNITYESLVEMDLLDRVVSETLRKYPVANALIRECNRDYPIEGTDMALKKGDMVWFPLMGYHYDPEHWPNPEKFDPDRFLPEEKANRHPYAYMPFGEGPRNCIGNRFGLMQVKVGLTILLSDFNVSPSKKTLIPMVFDPKVDILTAKGGLYFKLSKRQK